MKYHHYDAYCDLWTSLFVVEVVAVPLWHDMGHYIHCDHIDHVAEVVSVQDNNDDLHDTYEEEVDNHSHEVANDDNVVETCCGNADLEIDAW